MTAAPSVNKFVTPCDCWQMNGFGEGFAIGIMRRAASSEQDGASSEIKSE